MEHRAYRYILWSQLSLLGGILLCCLIRPAWAQANYPISYFGNFRATIVPYALGFALCAYWLIRAVMDMPAKLKAMRWLLVLIAICSLAIPCTPYMINSGFGQVHLLLALSLLCLELSLSILIIRRTHHGYALLGFAVQLCGAVLAVLSQIGLIHMELIGELLVVIGFGLLLMCDLALLTA